MWKQQEPWKAKCFLFLWTIFNATPASAASRPLSSFVCSQWSDGKGPLEPGCPDLALTAMKDEPNILVKPSSHQNTDRKGKEPSYSFLETWLPPVLTQLCSAESKALTLVRSCPSCPVCWREKVVNVKFSRKITAGPWRWSFPQPVSQYDPILLTSQQHTGCILSSSIFPIQMAKVKILSSDPVPEVNELNSLGEQARVWRSEKGGLLFLIPFLGRKRGEQPSKPKLTPPCKHNLRWHYQAKNMSSL